MPASGSNLVVLAVIAGAHGVRGDVRIKPFGDADRVCSYGPFLDEAGQVILTPVHANPGPKGALTVRVKENLTREQVQALKGALLHVPRAALPDLDENEFYCSDLIGLRADNLEGDTLGEVKAVHDFGAGTLLEISGPDGVWLLPFTKTAAPRVDMKAGKIIANPPKIRAGGEQKEE